MTAKNTYRQISLVVYLLITAVIIAVWLFSLSSGSGKAVDKASQTAATAPVKIVTPADYAAELDNSDNVLIQLCKPEQCDADRKVLERVKGGFATVKFVQMSSRDNPEFAQRLESEQQQLAKANNSQDTLAYPVYIFKGADLNVAPHLESEAQLKQFIATNIPEEAP
ncbi:MAG TPA: hypothetical protein PKZ32_16125 [Candidatus Melainabacteria bacterium]|nr:hypothetical protein [Candidatus Melainabacteria bacterium]